MDALQTLIIGLGYHENSFKNWVIDRANEYNETDAEELKEKLEAWKFDGEDYPGQFEDWKNETPTMEDEELHYHYRATEEDESEFDDYGMRIPEDRVGFEWGDELEEDEDLFEGDDWKPNQKLVEANERYKSEVKKMNTKQKKKSK
jgi:hypothetical protein